MFPFITAQGEYSVHCKFVGLFTPELTSKEGVRTRSSTGLGVSVPRFQWDIDTCTQNRGKLLQAITVTVWHSPFELVHLDLPVQSQTQPWMHRLQHKIPTRQTRHPSERICFMQG